MNIKYVIHHNGSGSRQNKQSVTMKLFKKVNTAYAYIRDLGAYMIFEYEL